MLQQRFFLPDDADRQCVCIDESVLSGFPDISQIVLRLREGTPFDASDLFVVGCAASALEPCGKGCRCA